MQGGQAGVISLKLLCKSQQAQDQPQKDGLIDGLDTARRGTLWP